MDLQLKGKVAVITGATLGIGRAMAELFAGEGVNVAVCGRNAERVGSTVEALEQQGVKAFGQPVDVADGAELKGFIDRTAAAFGGIDIFVSNASSLTHGADASAWKAVYDIDMMGAVHACEAVLPHLLSAAQQTGDASFLAISSTAATQAAQADAYGAIKAALVNYIKGLSREHAPHKVRFNAISPGTIHAKGGSWDRIREHQPELYDTMISLNPTGRMGTPEEIAAAAVFLSSPRSSFTTGANLVIDGSMGHRVNY